MMVGWFGPEMKSAYSGFSAAKICQLITYLDTYPLTYSPAGPTRDKGRQLMMEQACYST